MILVIDKTISDRAIALRRRLLDLRFPCAVSSVRTAHALAAAFCIVTFTDVLEDVRRKPLDHIPAFVLGDGFVNSALNAIAVRDIGQLPDLVTNRIMTCLETEKTEFYCGSGYFLSNGFVITDKCIYYRAFPLPLNEREYRILQLLLFQKTGYMNPRQICAYCYPFPCKPSWINSIHVHVSGINRIAGKETGRKFIANKYGVGYRIEITPVKIDLDELHLDELDTI